MKFFLGAHGTGKSTLLEGVKQTHPNYILTEGLSRPLYRAIEKYGIVIEDAQRQAVLNDLTAHFYTNLCPGKEVLATRSIIDVIVYTKILYPELDIQPYLDIWNKTKHQVEKIFFLPIEFDLQTDDIRKGVWGDPEIQKTIQQTMQDFIDSEMVISGVTFQNKVIRVEGSVEQRLEILKNHL